MPDKIIGGIAAGDIVETVPSALLILDRHLVIASANRAFYQMFRTSQAETEGCHIFRLGNGQWDIPAVHVLLESLLPDLESVERFEVDHDFPAIGRRTMLVNARKISQPGLHEGSILLAIEDVSEERAARAESQLNWQLTQSIVDTMRDPMVVLEGDMTVVTASRSFLTMFGITQDEARGRLVGELGQHQWDVPGLRLVMDKVLPEDRPFESFEIEDDFPGLGRRVFNLNARKISQPGNHTRRMLLVFEDITDRKQRERDIQLLNNEVSHRIKNNLQIIVGLIGYEARITPTACVQGYRAMQARIGAIAQLYDLIAHSDRSGTVAVADYLREISKTMTASLLTDNAQIAITVEAEPLLIDANHAVPFGLLVNELGTNAIKHAFPSGAGHVRLIARRVDGMLELTVSDDGVGISPDSAPPTSEKRGSNYVDIFVRQLGGVRIASGAPGKGAAVTVRLPLLTDANA